MEKAKKNYVVIILGVLLVLALGYIIIDKYNEGQRNKFMKVYEQGYNDGAKETNELIVDQVVSDLNTMGSTVIRVPAGDNKTATIPLIAQTTIIKALNNDGFYELNTVNQDNETVKVKLIMPSMCDQFQE